MTKKKRYTTSYILKLLTLPFLIVGYFFRRMLWSYVIKKKPFIEWTIFILSIAIVVLVISGLIRGDFKPGKEGIELQKHGGAAKKGR
jgi:hypothetical protein